MEKKDIYELMDRFDKSGLGEIELEMQGVKVVMRKGGQVVASAGTVAMPSNMMSTITNNSTIDNLGMENNTVVSNNENNINQKTINAPLVGTFYRAPSPDDKPYVEVGSKVKKGDVIGIIEAMKLMNEITATEDGEITAIEVENGEMVEYDQVIMRIK